MSAWLLQSPPRERDRHPRYLVEPIDDRRVRTTPLPLMARRFASADQAREFAASHAERFADWRVVRR